MHGENRLRKQTFGVHTLVCSVYSRFTLTVLGVMYRSISVDVMRYSPQVQCHNAARSTPPSYYSCLEVLDRMQWSESMITFGFPWQVRLLRGT